MSKVMNKLCRLGVGVLMLLILSACAGKEKVVEPPHEVEQVEVIPAPPSYQVSAEEKAYLSQRFADLSAINPETVGYLYAPGTKLDEPIVQTGDNATYLDKTFEGVHEPLMGAVFMDKDNAETLTDRLTWLFGHARGSMVPDHRMFNDVNFYDNQTFFDQHPYVVIEMPERKYYYEAAFFLIVPEDTAFYRTSFENDADFEQHLQAVRAQSPIQNPRVTLKATDKYLVLSTCREYDDTLRANLYLRQIPDAELPAFLAEHGDQLVYQPTR